MGDCTHLTAALDIVRIGAALTNSDFLPAGVVIIPHLERIGEVHHRPPVTKEPAEDSHVRTPEIHGGYDSAVSR